MKGMSGTGPARAIRPPFLKVAAAALAAVVVLFVSSGSPKPAGALFHFAVIDEVMSGYNSDPNVQYIEIRMLSPGQNLTAHSIIGYFDATGAYVGDILEVPADVPSGSALNPRWIVGTPQYAAVSGITPEFTFAPVAFPATGMICFGGGTGVLPQNPPTWVRTNMANWADCVPYGGYTATPNKYGSCPAMPNCFTPFGLGNGTQSLTRLSITNNPPVDWGLACPTPTSNKNSLGLNNDNHIDLPQTKAFDDLTWPNSDLILDNCPGVSPDTDDDNDGLLDTTETGGPPCASASAPTNPLVRDTDGDRALDGPECTLGFDPASAASGPPPAACGAVGDVDGDKIQNRLEVCNYNTNPNANDTDGDALTSVGARDGCEMASINSDNLVNSGDQGALAVNITTDPTYIVDYDLNKDGGINSGDQGLMASLIVPPGQCP